MSMITGSFRLHIDPSLYAFKWKDAEYITVEYTAAQLAGDKISVITHINAPMYLLGMIVVADKWIELDREVIEAARSHAMDQFRNQQVHPTIMSALAPFI